MGAVTTKLAGRGPGTTNPPRLASVGEATANLGEVDLLAKRGGEGLAQAVPGLAAARGQEHARGGHVEAVAEAPLARIGRGGGAFREARDER
jgi:hypothetical protein